MTSTISTSVSLRSLLTICNLSLLLLLSSSNVSAQKIQDCTKSEINEIAVNANIRGCAEKYSNILSKQGCTSLEDQNCFCARPDFIASVLGCVYLAEPDVQSELLRCLKWYECDSLNANLLNSTGAVLTPESTDLIAKGKSSQQSSKDSAISNLSLTLGFITAFTLLVTSTLLC